MARHRLTIFVAILILFSLSFSSNLSAGRGRYKKLHVLPAKGKVIIDGDLKDWDLSAQIQSDVVPETAHIQSGKTAMMYDDEALYISGVIRDSSPMMNRHDPKTNPSRAWDADVCQIFFSLDPDEERPLAYSSFNKAHKKSPVGTMFLWYYTDDKQPSLAMYRGMKFNTPLRPDLNKKGVIPNADFEAVFKKMDDGLGYIFEYKIPWKTFPMKRKPKAGDKLAASVCLFWGRPDGLKTAGGAAWSYDVMCKPGFPFQAANCWGDLIFEEKNNIARDIVDDGLPPKKPLPLKFKYELPEDSEVTVQLFDEQNQSVRILVPQQKRAKGVNIESWDGLDAAGKPLVPGKYQVKTITHQPIIAKFQFSVHNSGKPPYPTGNNRGGWGGDHGRPQTACKIPGGMALAWDACEYGWGIIKVDNKGNKLWGSKHNAKYMATDGKRLFIAGGHGFSEHAGVKLLDLKDSRPLNLPSGASFKVPAGGSKETDQVSGLSYANNKLYVSFKNRNIIAIYNTKSGELTKTWTVKAPERMTMLSPDSLAVISEGKVIKITDGKSAELLTTNLDSPVGIAVDEDGTFYVSNQGELQDIAVFDKSGKYLRSIGIKGGRPAIGLYNPEGLYMPGGIALGIDGNLWVAEASFGPKRISVWNTKSGKLVEEFFGSSDYFGYGFINPDDPNMMYANYVLWKIDWKKKKGYPYTTIWRKTEPNMMEAPSSSGYNGVFKIITAENGRQYGWGNSTHKSVLMRRDGNIFKPFAAVMMIGYGWSLYRGLGIPLMDENKEKYPKGNYFWQDKNDDQTVQEDEVIKLSKKQGRPNFALLEKDLTLWVGTGQLLKPVKVLENGQPVYDLETAEDSKLKAAKAPVRHGYIARDKDGNTYTFASRKGPSLVKWNPEGELLWSHNDISSWRKALSMPIVDKGRLWGMTGLMGIAGDYFANMTYFGPNHIFNKDGVYVAMVLRDGRVSGRGKKGHTDEGQPEGQNGQFVKLKIDGKDRYFIIHGGQDSRVWEVFNLDTVQSLPDWTFELTAPDAKLAKTKFDEYQKAITKHQNLLIVKNPKKLRNAKAVEKIVDNKREFKVKAAYDADNLYIEYKVKGSVLNNSQSESQLIFRGGNLIDIQMALDEKADAKRKKPAPGDTRFLITRKKGKTFAVVYEPKVKGFSGKPIIFKSPTGEESFDRIDLCDKIKLRYTEQSNGFTALVTIPKALLGNIKLQKGTKIKMDLGYIFANKEGSRTSVRAYWKNNSFTANVTNDIPHESRIEPNEWGEATFE